jgi:hypothetical protein
MDFPQSYARCVEKQNSFLPNPAPNDIFETANKCLEAINKVYMDGMNNVLECKDLNCLETMQEATSEAFMNVLRLYGLL